MKTIIVSLLILAGCVDSTGNGIFDAYTTHAQCNAKGWNWVEQGTGHYSGATMPGCVKP